MATLRIGNFDLYYEVHGEGSPVVFAHGVGGNHAGWFHQLPAFSGRHKAILFDHRGFGNSRDAADGPGRARFVDDLVALFDHLGLEQAAIVAQSMGGGTCAHFTWKHPKRVKALVLADTLVGLTLPDAIRQRVAAVEKAMDGRTQLERVLGETFRQRDRAGTALYAAIASFNTVNRKTLTGSLGAGPTPEDLAATGVPIHFLVGQEDVLYPPDIVRDVHKLVKGSRYAELPQAGHSAYFESPAAFNESVLTFLKDAGA
jgi:pimeloyl-ACP methyl ester carboxylesterase